LRGVSQGAVIRCAWLSRGGAMILDVVCLAGLLLFIVGGLLSGFLKQVVRLAALVGAFLLVSPVAGWIRGGVSVLFDVDRFPGNLALLVLAWLAGYVALRLAGFILLKILRGVVSSLSGPDRALGGLMGMVKGGVIVYVGVTVVLFFQEPLETRFPAASAELDRSRVVAMVGKSNPLLGWMREIEERLREKDLPLPFSVLQDRSERDGQGIERVGIRGTALAWMAQGAVLHRGAKYTAGVRPGDQAVPSGGSSRSGST
jgi:hypothetical protein